MLVDGLGLFSIQARIEVPCSHWVNNDFFFCITNYFNIQMCLIIKSNTIPHLRHVKAQNQGAVASSKSRLQTWLKNCGGSLKMSLLTSENWKSKKDLLKKRKEKKILHKIMRWLSWNHGLTTLKQCFFFYLLNTGQL